MSVHSEKTDPCRVNASDDQVGTDMSLVSEEMLFEHCHASDDSRFTACRESMEFEVGGDECSGKFSVGGCAGTGTPDLRGYIVEFLTILFEQ